MIINRPSGPSPLPPTFRLLGLPLQSRAMSQARRPPKRFAPLDPQKGNAAGAPPLKGVVFDVDGTLWYVNFAFFRAVLCCFFSI
jgi:hypothetical protein